MVSGTVEWVYGECLATRLESVDSLLTATDGGGVVWLSRLGGGGFCSTELTDGKTINVHNMVGI